MPTAREWIDIQGKSFEVQIEFQVWCANCGNGICRNTDYKKHSTNDFTTFCEKCDKKREELESENASLRERIEELEAELLITD